MVIAQIVSIKPLDQDPYYKIVGTLPRCEWREGKHRCTDKATVRIMTEIDSRNL